MDTASTGDPGVMGTLPFTRLPWRPWREAWTGRRDGRWGDTRARDTRKGPGLAPEARMSRRLVAYAAGCSTSRHTTLALSPVR